MKMLLWILALTVLASGPLAAQPPDPFELMKEMAKTTDSLTLTMTAISDSEEVTVGKQIAELVNHNARLVKGSRRTRVLTVGTRLANRVKRKALLPYHFHVADEDSVVNSFSAAGGRVWVFTAMLDLVRNDDELAAVIAHEIAHVDRKHCIHRIQNQLATERLVGPLADVIQVGYTMARLPFTRDEEIEADTVGLRYVMEAGFDPAATLVFMDRMIALEEKAGEYAEPRSPAESVLRHLHAFFQSHPNFKERRAKVVEALARLKGER